VQNGRKRLIGGLAVAAVVAGAGMIPSSPATAKPSIKDVQAKVDSLYRKAEQASERYDSTRVRLGRLHQALGDLQADQSRQSRQLGSVRDQLKASVLDEYESSGSSVMGEVVTSGDPQSFLNGLSTLSSYNSVQSNLMSTYNTQVTSLGLRASATSSRLAQVQQLESQLQQDKDSFESKLADAKSLLGTLQEQQREALVSRSAPDARVQTTTTTPAAVPASGNAAAAIAFAMAQVGKAYVYGAAGPDAYDCSGLTMRAWGAAGVALPHSSAAQYNMGPHIAEADLQPGDLVFYYSPISHVGMYIGNGMIVNAENPSVGVTVTSLHSMPYVGAVRPG
jgi:peptidoglycan DL-endopeptidase CwlO